MGSGRTASSTSARASDMAEQIPHFRGSWQDDRAPSRRHRRSRQCTANRMTPIRGPLARLDRSRDELAKASSGSSSAPPSTMSLISSGSSRAICSVGQLADLVQRGALDQPDEPGLRELVPRAVEARKWAPDRCHAFAVTGWTGVAGGFYDRTPGNGGVDRYSPLDAPAGKIRRMADLIADSRGPGAGAGGRAAAAAEAVPLDEALGRVLAEDVSSRTRCRRSTARRWTATPWWPATRGRAERGRRGARRASRPARRCGAARRCDLDRRRGARGRHRGGAGRAHRAAPTAACACPPPSPAPTSAAPARTSRPASWCCAPADRSAPRELGVAASVGRATLRCARAPARGAAASPATSWSSRASRSRPGRSTARTRYALAAQVERAGARAGRARARARRPPRPPGGARRGARRRRRRVVSGGVSVGPARPRQGRAARRSGVEERFWGVSAAARASRPGSARATARSPSACPATRSRRWSPSSCSRARRSRRCRAPTRTPPAPSARARRGRRRATPAREQAVRVRLERAATTAGTPRRPRTAGLARAHARCWAPTALALIARRRRARRAAGERVRGRAAVRRARPAAAARAPPRAARARVQIVAEPRIRVTRRTAASATQAGRRGHAAARGARPDLVGRVPRAPGAHLLALPHARLARAAARALHADSPRGGAADAARSCCCASTRPSTTSAPTAAR